MSTSLTVIEDAVQLRKNTSNTTLLNNKDLLIVSLLEYICTVHDKPDSVHKICEYLVKHSVIADDSVSHDNSSLRGLYVQTIRKMMADKPGQLMIEDFSGGENGDENSLICHQKINSSRYTNDFVEIEKLGSGGFGSVFKAYHKIDDKAYAVKRILMSDLNSEKSRFYLNESRVLADLVHKNIVRYYGTWVELHETNNIITPELYIQMELCTKSLADRLEERNYGDTSIDTKVEKKLFLQIVDALSYVHECGVVHGDISCANIFLDKDMNIKVGDFGLSKRTEDVTVMASYGNMLYMAPERLEGVCNYASDVFSLGLIYVELMTIFGSMTERVVVLEKVKRGDFSCVGGGVDSVVLHKMVNKDWNSRITVVDVKKLM